MPKDSKTSSPKSLSIDWLIRGFLTKLGDIFDAFTGRRWKPSSSLATSELVEKLKRLLDSKVRDSETAGKFVPHIIELKMQWDKFSTDSEESLRKLENELLIAAVDFINDNRYHTYAPLKIDIKPDYFTDGVKLSAGYGEADESADDAVNVTVPDLKNVVVAPEELPAPQTEKETFIAKFMIKGKTRETRLDFETGERKTIGRAGGNDLWLDDTNVSKMHAALMLNGENQLVMSDTGSTNGTFLGGERIAYGKAIPLNSGDKIKFGTVEVEITKMPKPTVTEPVVEESSKADAAPEAPLKALENADHLKVLEGVSVKPGISKKADLRKDENPSPVEKADNFAPPHATNSDDKEISETPMEKPETSENDNVEDLQTEAGIVFDFDEK